MDKLKRLGIKLGYALLFQILLYIIHFILAPSVLGYKTYIVLEFFDIFYISTVVITFLGQFYLVKSICCWIVTIPIYPVLIHAYHPKYIYDIGRPNGIIHKDTNVDIIVITLVTLVIELLVCIMTNIIRFLIRKHNQNRSNNKIKDLP